MMIWKHLQNVLLIEKKRYTAVSAVCSYFIKESTRDYMHNTRNTEAGKARVVPPGGGFFQ